MDAELAALDRTTTEGLSAWASEHWDMPLVVSQHVLTSRALDPDRADQELVELWRVRGLEEMIRSEVRAGLLMGRVSDEKPTWVSDSHSRKPMQVFVWSACGDRCWIIDVKGWNATVVTLLPRRLRHDDDYRLRTGQTRVA